MENILKKPAFSLTEAEQIASEHFGISGTASFLPGERDQNIRIDSETGSYVIKVANPETELAILELENSAIQIAQAIEGLDAPRLVKSSMSDLIERIQNSKKQTCFTRCITFLPGTPLAKLPSHPPKLLIETGRLLGALDRELANLNTCSAAKRELTWDLANSGRIVENSIPFVDAPEKKELLVHFLEQYQRIADRLPQLRKSVIHNDANDYNLLIHHDSLTGLDAIGLIDFGDIVYSTTINDLAICCAYVLLDKESPLDAVENVVAGYHESLPLDEAELSVLFPLICMRLCHSVCMAAEQQRLQPDNEYLGITEKPAWSALQKLRKIDSGQAHIRLSEICHSVQVCNRDAAPIEKKEIQTLREKHISPSLSLSYDKPLQIVRGRGQYLFDESDVTYLDCVNNVCHVGHCHPDVVDSAARQMATLNTNTRYLHENIVRLAERLTDKLPSKLEVCFFVNSGSEANDLALRLAKTYTGGTDVAVIDHAYHGHVSSLIELSPYKFNHQGGLGQADHVHVVPAPDGFRGIHKYDEPDRGPRYAALATEQIQAANQGGRKIAAFFAESLLSCGGQIELPPNYLKQVYQSVRAQGGICVADEVQVGFGRVGEAFWGFELQGVTPDIVTMGKPIGNGHPLAAVVTTREIADAFNNGMEYFNTFGGNPVSCAVGLSVLNVIEREELQRNALEVGNWILSQWRDLQSEFDIIGDVRGKGLFLGIEFVKCRESLEPATEFAHAVVQKMQQRRILLSTDGPLENVIKFKPPMVFTMGDAERVVMTLRETIRQTLENNRFAP